MAESATTAGIELRGSGPEDLSAIEALYGRAFPEEELRPLVQALLDEPRGVLSLVGLAGGSLAGHAAFTECGVAGSGAKVALLGPLAVDPDRQRGGIGTALVRAGLERLEAAGTARVLVLGDPAYYGRLGFAPEEGIAPPYPLPPEWRGAWQSLGPGGVGRPARGRLVVPGPWRRRALWAP